MRPLKRSTMPLVCGLFGARLVEEMVAGGRALAVNRETVGKPLAVVGQHLADAHGACRHHGTQKGLRGPGRLARLHLQKHPARGAVNGHTTTSCSGVSVVRNRCGLCERSSALSRFRQRRMVSSVTPYRSASSRLLTSGSTA